jgi:CRISPR-associated protein Cas1
LWQQTIKTKIKNQATVLAKQGLEIQNMLHWVDEVKSGDTENHEGRASAWYWKNIFGREKEFIREPVGPAPNNLLNYAYAILRAIAARSLVGSGLLPTLGIFHRNQYNAYCLADDVMEPYRPFADQLVLQLIKEEGIIEELTTDVKKKLLTLPTLDVKIGNETSPLMIAMQRTTASLAKCFLGETRKIAYPEMV